jgi:hypothetical protein
MLLFALVGPVVPTLTATIMTNICLVIPTHLMMHAGMHLLFVALFEFLVHLVLCRLSYLLLTLELKQAVAEFRV